MILAILITICLVVRILISRQFLNISEHPDFYPDEVLPETVLQICIIVVLSVSINRWIGKTNQPANMGPWKFIVASIISLALVLIILPDRGLIVYLVHIATAGIEHYHPAKFHREGTFPNQQLQGFRLFWLALAPQSRSSWQPSA